MIKRAAQYFNIKCQTGVLNLRYIVIFLTNNITIKLPIQIKQCSNRKLKRKFFCESSLQINRAWETMRALFNVNWLNNSPTPYFELCKKIIYIEKRFALVSGYTLKKKIEISPSFS